MSIFKLYLGRILGTFREGTDSVSGMLGFYQDKFRALIGKVVMQNKDLSRPKLYIPLFYQQGLRNASNIFSVVKKFSSLAYIALFPKIGASDFNPCHYPGQ